MPSSCVFGPVPSRRLGRSLGINPFSAKECSYSCVYCQVGRTTRLTDDRRPFLHPERIRDDVARALEAAQAGGAGIDFVSFVPSGEPTLDAGLGRAIDAIKRLGVRVAVFTNGSLLWRWDVRDEIEPADWVSIKVDAATEAVWRRINRPCKRLSFGRLLDGAAEFARGQHGTLVTETMLIAGVNDGPDEIDRISRTISALAPSTAWLALPTRPPAESWVRAPAAARYEQAIERFTACIRDVRPLLGNPAAVWQTIDADAERLLAIAAVHPLRDAEVNKVLPSAPRRHVDELVAARRLEAVTYAGERFYRAVLQKEHR